MSEHFMFSKNVKKEEIAPGVYRKIMGWTPELMIIHVDFGEKTAFPPHSHPHVQITYVVDGRFEIEIDKGKSILSKGDVYVVPGNTMHAVKCLEKGVLLDTFSPAREDFLNDK